MLHPALLLALAPLLPQTPAGQDLLAWGDFDADGLPDVLVVRPGEALRLLRNLGGGSFADASAAAGLEGIARPLQGSWQDVDGDRDLDLLVLGADGPTLHLNAAGVLVDATRRAGLAGLGRARAAEWRDFDLDGRPDLQLATDRGALLLHNVGGGSFTRVDLGLPGREDVAPVARPSSGAGSTLAASAGAGLGAASSAPPHAAAAALGICAGTLFDSALGGCLSASTAPVLGALMPLSIDFNLDLAGNVGIGTTTPAAKLDVVGDVRASGKLVSTTTSGAPLTVASTTKVAGLNADLLDGLDAGAFSQLGSSIEGAEITNGTITAVDLANGAVGTAQLASKAVASGNIATGAVTSIALATGSVDTTKLADGTILDADVSAIAAIAGTKVVPDFGSQVVTTLGSIGVGAIAPQGRLDVVDVPGTDGSVNLPDDSISAVEMLDEPGLAFARVTSPLCVDVATPQAAVLASRVVSCPSDGYILALASTRSTAQIPASAPFDFSISLDSTSHDPGSLTTYDRKNTGPDDTLEVVAAVPVTAGSHTLYFLASRSNLSVAGHCFFGASLTLIFVPTAYGQVDP